MSSTYQGPNRIEILVLIKRYNEYHPDHRPIGTVHTSEDMTAVLGLEKREQEQVRIWYINHFIRYLQELRKDATTTEDNWKSHVNCCAKNLDIAKDGKAQFVQNQQALDAKLAADTYAPPLMQQELKDRRQVSDARPNNSHEQILVPEKVLQKNHSKSQDILGAWPSTLRMKKSKSQLQKQAVRQSPLSKKDSTAQVNGALASRAAQKIHRRESQSLFQESPNTKPSTQDRDKSPQHQFFRSAAP